MGQQTRALSLRRISVADHPSTTRVSETTTAKADKGRCKGLEKGSSESYLGQRAHQRVSLRVFHLKAFSENFDETRQVDILFFLGSPIFRWLIHKLKPVCISLNPMRLVRLITKFQPFYPVFLLTVSSEQLQKYYVHTYLELDMSISFRRKKIY